MKSDLEKVTKHLRMSKKITDNTNYEIKKIDAIELLTPNRIDLVVKIKFLENIYKNLNCSFISEMYEAHLKAFNGNGKCSEAGDDNKNDLNDYINSFMKTANSIQKNGFNSDTSLIPIGKNNVLLDGAHRTASAIYFNKKVEVIKFKDIDENYNYKFFQNNLLDEKFLDYMVLEYCKLKKNTFVFCIWPAADKSHRNEVYDLIKQETSVIYEKEFDLNYNGYRNFMIQIYKDFTSWIGNYKNHYKGVYSQLDPCYKSGIPLKIFVVEAESMEKVINLKKKIRDIFNIGNFSIHSTDNQEETIKMLEILLNTNSVYLLNYGNPDKYKELNEKIELINQTIQNNNINKDNFIIDSDSVLALFGLRESNDIGYLSLNNDYHPHFKNIDVDDHFDCIDHYDTALNEMILNPNNYLTYQGVKFISLDILEKMKASRNNTKDLIDIELIKKFRKNNSNKFKVLISKLKSFTVRLKKQIKLLLINLLKKLHLYDFIYKICKGSKGK